MKSLFIFLTILTLMFNASVLSAETLQNLDIIFHTSRSAQSLAVQRATNSRYSHMGIIYHQNGKPYVFEAVSTVKYTPLNEWIERGVGQHYVVKRLKGQHLLNSATSATLSKTISKYQGKPYDLTFEWDDSKVYCSELVWKIYRDAAGVELTSLQKMRDFNLDDPQVQTKIKERYGNDIPLDEPVVSPQSIFESPLLTRVISKP